MYYTTLKRIQKFKHYGHNFISNDAARLIYRDSTYCIVLLRE